MAPRTLRDVENVEIDKIAEDDRSEEELLQIIEIDTSFAIDVLIDHIIYRMEVECTPELYRFLKNSLIELSPIELTYMYENINLAFE